MGVRQATAAYFPGSVPVIFLMPLAPVRSTAAFSTAKIAPWTATSTSLVLYSGEVACYDLIHHRQPTATPNTE